MALKLKPIGDKLLVKRLEAEEKTRGGIVLPDSAKEKPAQGTVVALGDGKKSKGGDVVEFQVKKGDTVLFSSYAGTEVKDQGEDYLIMSESDILAIIE